MDVQALITNFGFPVCTTIFLAMFINSYLKDMKAETKAREDQARKDSLQREEMLRKDSLDREERTSKQIDKFSITLENFNCTLIRIDARLSNLESELGVKQEEN